MKDLGQDPISLDLSAICVFQDISFVGIADFLLTDSHERFLDLHESARIARQDAESSLSATQLAEQRDSAAHLRLELLRHAASIDYASFISPGD